MDVTMQWWWSSKDSTFTVEEISQLLAEVKEFNAGAIDEYLTKHVDVVFDKWLKKKGVK